MTHQKQTPTSGQTLAGAASFQQSKAILPPTAIAWTATVSTRVASLFGADASALGSMAGLALGGVA